jgi:hypothetical protein
MTLNRRLPVFALASSALLYGACGTENLEPAAPLVEQEPTTAAAADRAAGPSVDAVVPIEAPPWDVAFEFRGYADPARGIFEVTIVGMEYARALEQRVGDLRTTEQGLWCNLDVNRGFTEQVRLQTVPGTIREDEDCAPPGDIDQILLFESQGAFCADQILTNNYGESTLLTRYGVGYLGDVHTEIVDMTPPTGFEGYRYPLGTGAPTKPGLSNLFGLWSYGDLQPNESNTVTWVFNRGAGDFSFTGFVRASFQEVCDGRDNNCNGIVDEGASCYPDGDPCSTSADCISGICAGGTCGVTSFLVRGVVGTGGGGTMASPTRQMTVRIGAPQPMGEANGPNFGIRLGPLSDF